MTSPRPPAAASLDHPPDDLGTGISNVTIEGAEEPPTVNSPGLLCLANGTVTVPVGHTFVGVFAKVLQQNPNPAWSRDDLVANAGATVNVLDAGGGWNLNQSLTALCGPNMPYPDNWFQSVAVTEFFDPNTESIVQEGEVQSTNFKGKYAAICPAGFDDAKRTLFAASKIKSNQVHPVRRNRGWLLYRGLSTSLAGPGNVLMRKGKPLRASVLAIAADNVYWEHKIVKPDGTTLKRGFVRRAVGDLMPAPDHFLVANAPQYALLAMQETAVLKPFAHVIASESRKRPDFVHLNPEKDIRIQVNYTPRENVRVGTFDLWVKVIAE